MAAAAICQKLVVRISELLILGHVRTFHRPQPARHRVRVLRAQDHALPVCAFGPVNHGAAVEVPAGLILEVAVPYADLKRKPEEPIHMFLEAFQGGQSVDRAPREGAIESIVPSPDFEMIMWQV